MQLKNFLITTAFVTLGVFMQSVALADSVQVNVNGMVCGFCAQGITKKLNNTQSVEKVNVDLEKKIVSFETIQGKQIDDEAIKKLITDAGYTVVKIERNKK